MPHKCANCGREYRNGAKELLAGCAECGGKKFFFVPYVRRHEKKKEPEPPKEVPAESSPAVDAEASPQIDAGLDKLESVRIVSPGTYELNISKMANSDERVVGIGRGEGSYIVDLLSMVKPKSGKKHKKSK